MKSRWTPIAVAAWMACGSLLGDVVIPSERVTSGVNIREHPTTQSQIIGVLTPGMKLEYVGSIPRWNELRLSDGTPGFVSKSWTH